MEPMIERCCGLDVHQATVVACVLIAEGGRRPRREVRSFPTVTRSLLELRDWLQEHGCTHVAMESTGIFWRPVYALLEGAFELVVGNAQHMKNVPGRKTDVKDAEWIAELLRMGLIRKSFVPPPPIRELRDLMRYRRRVIESRSNERNRLLKLLETANIKPPELAAHLQAHVDGQAHDATVVTDETGKTPRQQEVLRTLKRLLRKLGLKERSFHSLRHSFLSRLVRRGASVEAVRMLAGHSSLTVTERYVHATASDLRRAIGLLH